MKFHFQNLALLDDMTVDLADLTLICGENNTGKTYATYAVYGFLRSWRQLLRGVLGSEVNALLQQQAQYQLNLVALFNGKVDSYLHRLGKAYVRLLPRVFATSGDSFAETTCELNSQLQARDQQYAEKEANRKWT